jgi:hypothetical protein
MRKFNPSSDNESALSILSGFFIAILFIGYGFSFKAYFIPAIKLLIYAKVILKSFIMAIEYVLYSVIILLIQNILCKKGKDNILVGNEPNLLFTKTFSIILFFIFGFINGLFGFRGIITSYIIPLLYYDYPLQEIMRKYSVPPNSNITGILIMVLSYIFHTLPLVLILTTIMSFFIKPKKSTIFISRAYTVGENIDNKLYYLKIGLSNYIYYIVFFFPILIYIIIKLS